MSDTKNELETLLEKAATEPAHRPAFFSALLEATVWVPGRAADGEQIVEDSALDLQHWEKDDGTSVIPFFTSLEALQHAALGQEQGAASEWLRAQGLPGDAVLMPVMAPRAWVPCSRTTVEKAASYSPQPIAMPMTAQARNRPTQWLDCDSPHRPAAKTRLLASSTGRPPHRSISLPAWGANAADTISATEKAANTVNAGAFRSRAMGPASRAGR